MSNRTTTTIVRQFSDRGSELFRKCLDDEEKEEDEFVVGDIVMAKWEHDAYYAAEIVRKISDHSMRVLYVDYGNYATVQRKDMYRMDKNDSAKVDVDKATTIMEGRFMKDFDPLTGKQIEDSASSGGASSGGGGSQKTRGQRKIGGYIKEKEDLESEAADAMPLLYGLALVTGKGSEFFAIRSTPTKPLFSKKRFAAAIRSSRYAVERLGRVRAPGGAVTATASRRGGQSALRFARLAEAHRADYVKSVARELNLAFADVPTGMRAIVVAGSKDLKNLFRSPELISNVGRVTRNLLVVLGEDADSSASFRPSRVKLSTSKRKARTLLSDHDARSLLAKALERGGCIR